MVKRKRGQEVKGKKQKDKPCSIYVFTEGDTEEIYLKHYENRKYGIKVISIDPKHTDALGIVKKAKAFIDEGNLEIELGDKCYCVFDSDPKSNTEKNFKEAVSLVRNYKHKGLECIFSNPSFEIWFILHFKAAPYGKTALDMKKMIKDLVKDKYPSYCETTDILGLLKDKQIYALEKAKELHNKQVQNYKDVLSHACNPYTNIFEFVQYVESMKKMK